MPKTEPGIILILNEDPQEIKVVTINLRRFFPESRTEIAYSTEEALTVVSAMGREVVVILIDQASLPPIPFDFTKNLKQEAPYATIVIQTARTDSGAAFDMLQAGADYLLYKLSPAFLAELYFCASNALSRRTLKHSFEKEKIRHHQLMEMLGNMYYELDAEGRFTLISSDLLSLLGYQSEELIGLPYHTIIPPTQHALARFRFNERRSEARAVTGLELILQRKPAIDGKISVVTAEITARGLYDQTGTFLGTVGIIKDLSERKQEERTLQEFRQQLQQTEALCRLAEEITVLSRELRQPLSTLIEESRQLSDTLREARTINRVDTITEHAAIATDIRNRLERILQETYRGGTGYTINHLLEDLLASSYTEPDSRGTVSADFGSSLPPYKGDREETLRLFKCLLSYAHTYLIAVGRFRILEIKTRARGTPSSLDAPTLFPLTPKKEIIVEISESDRTPPSGTAFSVVPEPINLHDLYQLAKELGATLNVSAPASGPLHIVIILPVEPPSSPGTTGHLIAPLPEETVHVEVPTSIQPEAPSQAPAVPFPSKRRTTPRVATTLPVQVTIGASAWDGTLTNISLGGACIELPGNAPSITPQEAYIVVRTAAGILELSGIVHERTESIPSRPGLSSRLYIVVFHQLNQTESAVLSSLIEAAYDKTLSFSLEILLEAGPVAPQSTGEIIPSDLTAYDRREALRVPVSLPAQIESEADSEATNQLAAQAINISRNGACLLVRERPDHIQGPVILHFPSVHRGDRLGFPEPGGPDIPLHARIIWSASDTRAPSALHAPGTRCATRVGVYFQDLTPYAERELSRVIRQRLFAQPTSEALPPTSPVLSVLRECRNARGQAIGIIDNHLRQAIEATTPIVIIAPGYGQTALDYLAFSHYLAEHRFRVLRYDHTNHIGNSEGELQHTTLRSMQHDLFKVVEFVRHTWPQAPTLVIASDLAARAALKAAVQIPSLDLLLLVNPSIDVGAMLTSVHGHDLVADYRFGLRRETSNLLGLNINVDLFISDIIAGHFTNLESTLDDLRLIHCPFAVVTSPATSPSIPPPDIPHEFIASLGAKPRMVNISTALTSPIPLAPAIHSPAFEQILEQITSVLPIPVLPPRPETSALPYLIQHQRMEQEYTCLQHNSSQVNRAALSAAHLGQLSQLGNLHEYRKLLDDLYGLLRPIGPDTLIVDIGIGESDLIRDILINHIYRDQQTIWTGKPCPLLVGGRSSIETIFQGRSAVQTLQRELSTGFVGRLAALPPISVGWIMLDWEESLPFKSGSLHRVISNLSLPYVHSPLAALREWRRVLHPDGRLILTAIHPDTDLSSLYRRNLRQAHQDEFSTQAQPLLHFCGRLREAICHRTVHTFHRDTLSALLRQAGMTTFQILPIFDGQASVAVIGKRNSSGTS
ncbi:PilZ domain-containing protein [Petrachloros mirabilis]